MNHIYLNLIHLFNSPRFSLLVIGLALFLTSPALLVGQQYDDYLHQRAIEQDPRPTAVMMDLFKFLPNDPAVKQELFELGLLPWWTEPSAYATFWRPLTAATHWVDYALWPEQIWLMHLHSLLYFALLVAAAGWLYQQLLGRGVPAGLALLLFALDDGHGFPVAWLANRNGLMAAALALITLILYDRWQRLGQKWAGGVMLLALGCALLAAEGGIGVWGFLLAYALCLAPAGFTTQFKPLLAPAGVTLIWLLLYKGLGYGTYGTGYADPFTQPLAYAQVAAERLPILLTSHFTPLPAELYLVLYRPFSMLFWLFCLGITLFLGWVAWRVDQTLPTTPAPHTTYTPRQLGRFFLCGMVLALLPAVIIFPMNRLLLLAGVGGMGWLAVTLPQLPGRVKTFFLVSHLLIAPLFLPFTSYAPALFGSVEPAIRQLPVTAAVTEQTVVVVNAPNVFMPLFIPYLREKWGLPVPAHLRLLASTIYPLTLSRIDENTVQLEVQGGYLVGLDAIVRGSAHPLPLHQPVVVPGLTAEVVELLSDGRAAVVHLSFPVSLNDPSLVWVTWHNGLYEPFELPAEGEYKTITPLTLAP